MNSPNDKCKLCGKSVPKGAWTLPTAWPNATSLTWAFPDSNACCSEKCSGKIRGAASKDLRKRVSNGEKSEYRQTRSRGAPTEPLPPPVTL